MFDTHCHLNFSDYEKDLSSVIKRSVDSGVGKIICASSNIADSIKAVEIARKYPQIVYASVGIHPQKTDPFNKDSLEKQIEILRKLSLEKEVRAIGECGLDFSPAPPEEENRPFKEQIFLFEEQIKIAKENNLALIVHSRKSFDETIKVLTKYQNGSLKGVFHCYTGGKKGITKVSDLGFYFGIDGNVTYDEGLNNVVKEIPIEKILLETDSPFLTPIPFRGQRNEPANLKIIAEYIAEIKKIDILKIRQETLKNSQKLFIF